MNTTTVGMSGQRRQAMNLARIVHEWNSRYHNRPTDETKEVHNSLCDLLDDLNSWLIKEEGASRVVGNRHLGPIQKTWNRLS